MRASAGPRGYCGQTPRLPVKSLPSSVVRKLRGKSCFTPTSTISDDSLTRSSCAEKYPNFRYKDASLLRWELGARCQAQPLPGTASRSQRWLWAARSRHSASAGRKARGRRGEEARGLAATEAGSVCMETRGPVAVPAGLRLPPGWTRGRASLSHRGSGWSGE